MMGLNISDGFKTAVTIYIIIPFLIIPQIILSGIIVRYEKLNPVITKPGTVPWFGEIITARWSYEALAVNQFINNKYQKPLYKFERIKHEANFKKDMIINDLRGRVDYYERHKDDPEKQEDIIKNFELLRNELKKESKYNKKVKPDFNVDSITLNKINSKLIKDMNNYLLTLKQYYIDRYKLAEQKQDEYIFSQTKTDSLNKIYIETKRNYHNEALEEILTNKNELKKMLEHESQLYQRTDMIYKYPKRYIVSHFYAPKKKLFDGKYYPTFWVNLAIIWFTTLILYFTLYFSVIRRTFIIFENIRLRFKDKKEKTRF